MLFISITAQLEVKRFRQIIDRKSCKQQKISIEFMIFKQLHKKFHFFDTQLSMSLLFQAWSYPNFRKKKTNTSINNHEKGRYKMCCYLFHSFTFSSFFCCFWLLRCYWLSGNKPHWEVNDKYSTMLEKNSRRKCACYCSKKYRQNRQMHWTWEILSGGDFLKLTEKRAKFKPHFTCLNLVLLTPKTSFPGKKEKERERVPSLLCGS